MCQITINSMVLFLKYWKMKNVYIKYNAKELEMYRITKEWIFSIKNFLNEGIASVQDKVLANNWSWNWKIKFKTEDFTAFFFTENFSIRTKVSPKIIVSVFLKAPIM